MRAFAWLERKVMAWFTRVWHGCCRLGPEFLPATGPALLIANHPSHADPGFLLATCSRPLCFLQARETFNVFGLRWLFRLGGCIPVSRHRADASAIRTALRRLQQGDVICVFPEGEVAVAGPDQIGPGKHGAALLALRSGAPVYPALIRGVAPGWHQLLDWLRPSRAVRVRYGPAVDLSAYHGRHIDHKLLDEVTAVLMQSIRALLPPSETSAAGRLSRGVPAAPQGGPAEPTLLAR
jgi:1-acyl-sn-glycerol-3-phosphate acyltransferase